MSSTVPPAMNPAMGPAMAGVLRRLARSPERATLVARGGLVTACYCAPHPRPAEDVDFLAELAFDPDDLERRIRGLLAVPAGDGIGFGPASFEVIWAETEFPGLRATVAVDGAAGEPLQIDIGVGDPMIGGPVELELLPGVSARACRAETMVAWKTHGLFERGPGKWRPKDLHDIDLLIRSTELLPELLRPSLRVAFESRGDDLALAERLARGRFGLSRWSRHKWRRFCETRPPGIDPGELADAVARVSAFLGPYLSESP